MCLIFFSSPLLLLAKKNPSTWLLERVQKYCTIPKLKRKRNERFFMSIIYRNWFKKFMELLFDYRLRVKTSQYKLANQLRLFLLILVNNKINIG